MICRSVSYFCRLVSSCEARNSAVDLVSSAVDLERSARNSLNSAAFMEGRYLMARGESIPKEDGETANQSDHLWMLQSNMHQRFA